MTFRSFALSPRHRFLVKIAGVLLIGGAGIFTYEMVSDHRVLEQAILSRARAHFADLVVARRWNAQYGGVYVEKRPGIASSPHLNALDIQTRDGKTYTLRNPALMAHEMASLADQAGDFSIHTTSLQLKNPANAPDEWERLALSAFANGEKERFQILDAGEHKQVRYMAPLFIEPACLQCHGDQGYKVGDVSGGIAVRFDVTEVIAAQNKHSLRTALTLFLLLGGVFALAHRFGGRLDHNMKELARRHADLVHSIDGIVWEADARTFLFSFVSEQAERLLGYPAADWSQPGFWVEHLHPDDRKWVPGYCAACTGRSENHDFEYRFIARDGRVVWLRDIVTVVADKGGAKLLRGVMLDITEQKKQESIRNELLTTQETILNNALVGIAYLRQRKIVHCNRRFETLFACASGELIGQPTEPLYVSHEAWIDVGRRFLEATGKGQSFSAEVLLRKKDGGTFWGSISGSAIDSSQPNDGSIWIFLDETDRRAAEEQVQKLRLAIEQCPVSILMTDPEGTIEYVNPAFCTVTGYSAQEAIGQNPRLLNSGQTPRETHAELWQTILSGRTWRGMLRNRRRNGDLFWEEASIAPVVDAAGKITNFVAVKDDVTLRKQIEDELGRYREHLEDLVRQRTVALEAALEASQIAEKTKDVFLANISHELRTPLNAVIGLSDLARQGAHEPRLAETLEKITDAGQTLLGIINDLLDLTKISTGEMRFESRPFSLRRIVARVRSAMGHKAAGKGLLLLDEVPDEVPDELLGDPLRIEQVMLNLVSNAIKFTPAGHVALRVSAAALGADRVKLRFEVEDTGIGLAAGEISRLFQPFVQADASICRRYGGTGLGLTICRKLVEAMGGEIGLYSVEGQGSTFHVTLALPRTRPELLPLPEPRQGIASPVSDHSGARVLLAEDQPINREVVVEMLNRVGVHPRIAVNGREAVDILLAEGCRAFDLVLMDIQMPILDGLAATKEIRARQGFAELPIVAMTAHTMTHEKQRYFAAGMDDHIGKPFRLAEFYQLLDKWLSRRPAASAAGADLAAAEPRLADIPGLDATEALERFSGNLERYLYWLGAFVAESAPFVADLRRLLAVGEIDEARRSLHAFKGRVGVLGMTGLHAFAAALEEANADPAATDALLSQLDKAVSEMVSALAQRLDHGARQALAGSAAGVGGDQDSDRPAFASLVRALDACDGRCARYLEELIAAAPDSPDAPLLRRALEHVRRFDFEAARLVLQDSDEREA